jgi:hypothetical protein
MLSLKDSNLAGRLPRRQAHSPQQVLIKLLPLPSFHLTFRHHDSMDSGLFMQPESASLLRF